jgi:hypothetical protein
MSRMTDTRSQRKHRNGLDGFQTTIILFRRVTYGPLRLAPPAGEIVVFAKTTTLILNRLIAMVRRDF